MTDQDGRQAAADGAGEKAPEAADARVLPPQAKRPKMSLGQQSSFLLGILDRCTMHSGEMRGRFTGEATLSLTAEDMLRLETIQQTLAIFDMEGAAELVRKEMWRKRQQGGRSG